MGSANESRLWEIGIKQNVRYIISVKAQNNLFKQIYLDAHSHIPQLCKICLYLDISHSTLRRGDHGATRLLFLKVHPDLLKQM